MYLGIDLGTSGVKVVLLDSALCVHAQASVPLALSHPKAAWSEQSPADWWHALNQAMLQLRSTAPHAVSVVRSIGLAGQMHGAVLLDGQRRVLRPAILWNDGRAVAQCAQLEAAEPRSRAITGNVAMAGFTAPKLLWLRQHEPSVFAQTRTVLLPKDWLRMQLTGALVSDMSDASGTLWMDVEHRRWSEAMLQACGLELGHMPSLVEGNAPSAELTHGVAQSWGMAAGVMVAGGAGDNAASAVGVGAVRAGEGFVSLGTSGVIFMSDDQYLPRTEHAVHCFAHALPQRWHRMSVMLSAASALQWASQLTGAHDVRSMIEAAAGLTLSQKSRAPIFLPYLQGERTPHNNPLASASLTGLRAEHGAADIAYAVMEGIGFGLRDGLTAIAGQHHSPKALALVGGGARSSHWAQLLASTLGTCLHRQETAHAAAAIGAARLGAMEFGVDEQTACAAPPNAQLFAPDPQETEMLLPRYQRFVSLYTTLQPHFDTSVEEIT
jgi:xylulokinase